MCLGWWRALSDRECACGLGQGSLCAPGSQQEVVDKRAECHPLTRGRAGDACVLSRTRDRSLHTAAEPLALLMVAPEGIVCDARDGLFCDGPTKTGVPLAARGARCASQ